MSQEERLDALAEALANGIIYLAEKGQLEFETISDCMKPEGYLKVAVLAKVGASA